MVRSIQPIGVETPDCDDIAPLSCADAGLSTAAALCRAAGRSVLRYCQTRGLMTVMVVSPSTVDWVDGVDRGVVMSIDRSIDRAAIHWPMSVAMPSVRIPSSHITAAVAEAEAVSVGAAGSDRNGKAGSAATMPSVVGQRCRTGSSSGSTDGQQQDENSFHRRHSS